LCTGYWFSINIIGIETPFQVKGLGNIFVYNEHCRYISANIASKATLIKMEILVRLPTRH
jgi:hypothetical protein